MSNSTKSELYTERLVTLEAVWWKKLIPVQLPYKLHLKALRLAWTLEIGCGIGRNMRHIGDKSVGVDHNAESIRLARSEGLQAFTSEDFKKSDFSNSEFFDSLLFAHILEHMTQDEAVELVKSYLRHLKQGGRAVVICPQEAGYRSDETHIEYMSLEKLKTILAKAGLKVQKAYSYPFPAFVGKFFTYNENVVIGIK